MPLSRIWTAPAARPQPSAMPEKPAAAAWIADPAGVEEVGRAMTAAPWVAIDTESNSMFVYRERVCLVQVNAGGRLFVIDPLALPPGPEALAPLRPSLEDPAKPVLLHGGEYDVGCLRRDYGIQLRGVFDSQQAASLLGWEKTGYGAAVEQVCGVALSKAYAQYDWATRPLDPAALRYAVDDVVYLPEVCERLRAAVQAADLVEEVAIANAAVEGAGWSGGFDPGGFWRMKGVRDVPQAALPMLAALWVWRDGVARDRDLPPGRLINNELLLVLAAQQPTNFGHLKKLGARSWFLAEFGERLIAEVKRAKAEPPALPPRPHHREVDDAERARENRLKDWRRAESEKRKVPLQVVLPAKALEHLKQHGAGDLASVPQLGGKRIRLYGEKLQQLCL